MKTSFQKAIVKIKEIIEDCAECGWTVKGYRYTRIKGIEKCGVDLKNEKGEILQYNYQI